MKIAIMGAGGMGGYVGGRLAGIGEDVTFIARGSHLEALKSNGLRIESPHGDLHVPVVRAVEGAADIGPVDMVFFAVKLGDTGQAAELIRPLLGPHTKVLTVQNGVTSADLIARHIPARHVVPGAIYLSAHLTAPGVVVSPGGDRRLVASARGGEILSGFADAINRSRSVSVEIVDDIDVPLWEKFVLVASVAAATSLMRTSVGRINGSTPARSFLDQLLEEAVSVARAKGVAVAPDLLDRYKAFTRNLPSDGRTSMSVDLENGKPLELEWLSGTLHRLGMQLGVPTPAHSAAYGALSIYAAGRPV